MKNVSARTYIWRIFKEMVHSGELDIKQWINLILENLEFETEE